MTRRSLRELEREVAEMGAERDGVDIQAWVWANLKDYYDGRLSAAERRLLERPEEYLSPAAKRRLDLEADP